MPSALKCLIEWVFLIQKIYFYFKLYSIFTINHFSCIKLYMHYNGLYVVQWCKWCWSYVWHLWKRPMHHHIFVSGQYWLIQYWHHILYWALNPKNVELGDEWRTHFQQEKKTPLLKSLSYRYQQKQKTTLDVMQVCTTFLKSWTTPCPSHDHWGGGGSRMGTSFCTTCDFVSKKQTRETGVQNGHHFAWHNIRWLCKKKSSLGNRVQDGHPTPGDSMALWEQTALLSDSSVSAKGQLHSSDIYGLMNN